MMRLLILAVVTLASGLVLACSRDASAPDQPTIAATPQPAPPAPVPAASPKPTAAVAQSVADEDDAGDRDAMVAPSAALGGADDIDRPRVVVVPTSARGAAGTAPAKPTPARTARDAHASTARRPSAARRGGHGVAVAGNLGPTLTPIDRRPHLAVGAVVTASSTHLGTAGEQAASALVDGDPTTRWSSAYTDGQWVTLDLREQQLVGRVRLLWELAAARAWSISTSADGATWTPLARRDDGVAGPRVDDVDLPATRTRWLRLDLDKRATAWGFSLFEVEVLPPR